MNKNPNKRIKNCQITSINYEFITESNQVSDYIIKQFIETHKQLTNQINPNTDC